MIQRVQLPLQMNSIRLFIQGFTTSLGNKSSGLSPSEFISKAWFEAKGYDMHYIMMKLGPGILNILLLMLLMHRTLTMFLNCLVLQPLT